MSSADNRLSLPRRLRSIGAFARRHSLLLAAGLGGAVGVGYVAKNSLLSGGVVPTAVAAAETRVAVPAPEPAREVFDTVQIALLLDTSSSMDGLINQARSQLWKMVNELGRGQRVEAGVVHKIQLEIALYEYGHSALPAASGHIRQVLPFTRDLDQVSEELFRLSTNGGEEYCGQVIAEATSGLAWSPREDVLKYVFIAGNEGFDQGPVPFAKALADAAGKGIHVQLIHCGGNEPTWSGAAKLAGSDLLLIDQNAIAQDIAAPQDAELAQLSAALNRTYVPIGAEGATAFARQRAQDANAQASGAGSAAARASVKSSKAHYKADKWDLVDGTELDDGKLAVVKDAELPAELRGKSLEEKKAAIEGKRRERAAIQAKIGVLGAERRAFLEAERKKRATDEEKSFDSKMVESAKKAASKKGYRF